MGLSRKKWSKLKWLFPYLSMRGERQYAWQELSFERSRPRAGEKRRLQMSHNDLTIILSQGEARQLWCMMSYRDNNQSKRKRRNRLFNIAFANQRHEKDSKILDSVLPFIYIGNDIFSDDTCINVDENNTIMSMPYFLHTVIFCCCCKFGHGGQFYEWLIWQLVNSFICV